MDLDIEQYNYAIESHWEYSIRTIAGVCTQIIDTPVTRSSLLYENRSLIKWADIGINLNINLKRKRRRDISVYLDTLPHDGIPNKLRGIPILFGITIVSHFSSYLLDKIMPNSDALTNNENNQIENKKCYYSSSMHLYNKCKQQNLSIAPNQIVDANAIGNIANANAYTHNWEHNKLIRKILISSLCSLITYPLYSIYVQIAFDFGHTKHNDRNKMEFKYPINGFCTNIVSIGKQIINENISNNNILSLYNGYLIHLLHNGLYELLVHYSREILIEIAPKLHSLSIINKYLSKKNDPFEYSMFCIWWIPPAICRAICYPLIKQQNKCIIAGENIIDLYEIYGLMVNNINSINNISNINIISIEFIKTIFDGVVGNTTRFMTEIQMCELFGLWSLIRFAHKTQYKQLIFEQNHNECTICYGSNGKADIVFVPCGHKFCKSDAYDVISRNMNCPTCRQPIQNSFTDLGTWKKLFLL